MSISLRKEQVLALLVIGLAAYIYSDLFQVNSARSPFSRSSIDLEVEPISHAPLVEQARPDSGRTNLFTQPRETQPLAPRELDFPPRAVGSVVALPLDVGPDYRHLVLLASAGGVVEGVTVVESTGNGGEATGDPLDGAHDPQDRAQLLKRAAKTYDRVTLVGQNAPIYGIVEVVGVDRFDAEKMTDFSNHTVRLHRYLVSESKLTSRLTWRPGDLAQVAKVELADNLRNEIERRKRALPPGNGGRLTERAAFTVWLLARARDEIWVYEEALSQARIYYMDSGRDIEGLRWIQRVLRASGDFAGEFAMLDTIDEIHRETSFRYEGLGLLQAQLNLVLDAEVNLRKAVALSPQDARPHAALAKFLLDQGRSREAVASAQRAQRAFGSLLDESDKVRVARVLVSCHLAVGDIDAAKNVRSLVSSSVWPRYLDGCIAYTDGDVAAALESFQSASSSVSAGKSGRTEAKLGEAASLLRLSRWQQAQDALAEVYDEAPLLRHRAACGMSLLHQRIGNNESALSWADRAIEANPQDAYAYYLRGRALRLSGQYQDAEEAQDTALKNHDDFVDAITEVARLYGVRSQAALGDQAALAVAAMRYSDRAVTLSPFLRTELFEFQGLRHLAAADPRGALTAFSRARDAATDDAKKLFAKGALAVVDYSLGRVDDAVIVLQRMIEDLGKEDPVRQWADATVTAIDDHAQKEMLEDRFERTEVGSIWLTERDKSLVAKIANGQLVFGGSFSTSGRGEVYAERASAVRKGKSFLAVACTLRVGPNHPRQSGFAGLRLRTQQGARGRTDFKIEVGIREGGPHLRITDNRQDTELINLTVAGFDIDGDQRLEVRVLPMDEDGRTFVMQVTWNGQNVRQQELQSLSGTTQTELKTTLFVQGNKGSEVDVAFDDYRLERKKER